MIYGSILAHEQILISSRPHITDSITYNCHHSCERRFLVTLIPENDSRAGPPKLFDSLCWFYSCFPVIYFQVDNVDG